MNFLERPILNVDDSEAGRYAKSRVLQGAGYKVVEAGTGADALRLVSELDPPLVLLDVMLPDMNGLDVCRMIKQDFPSTLVLQISATFIRASDRTRGLEAGSDSYLTEPVEPEELIANVHALMRLKYAEEQLRQLNDTLEKRVAERTDELQTANSRLLQSQKLEAIGQLTGGIAHDFNNLLAAVLGNLKLLRKRSSGDPDAVRLVDGAIEGALRGVSLTQRLLVFARRKELQVKPVDVAALVRGMHDMLRRSIAPEIRIDIDLPDDLWPAMVDPDQLELAILNLAVNARDAMPKGGALTIKGGNEVLARADDRLPAGDYVRLAVVDTGTGMDADTLARAIDPFFTTKGVGKGTGLGLSMVEGLAAQSGGALRLTSRVGEGTSAELWFMRANAAPVADQRFTAEPAGEESDFRPCRVLLVEDDALISMTTAEMLKDLGHDVSETFSGAEALEFLRSGNAVDVVITDQGMPHMTGLQLTDQIKTSWPALPVILATGYAELPKDVPADLPRLSKPFQQEELGVMIARAISAKNRAAR